MRFGTYNIQLGSNFEHVYNLIENTETINQLEVDRIALQEVDNFTIRHPIDQTLYIVQYNKIQTFQYFHFEKMRNFQNDGYGISILSKQTLIKRLLTYHYNNTTAEQYTIDLSIYFGTTHLGIGLNGSQQFNEAKQIVQWMSDNIIDASKNPYVILMTGDYNTIPSEDAIKNIKLSLFDDLWIVNDICQKIIDPLNINGYTFDSLHLSKRIDYIFKLKSQNFTEQIKFNCEIQVVSTLSSNHRPVVLNFDLL
ncbi:unnamed protein product [Rotaria sp. Silwood1]|nr:unnamed protein product [Rotaria sp. Silwood1]CAF1180326.1 unnamed protein product [Rotaria sp. Silwood1]CAF3485180.1 unnamed protein product [Rotaria sp. Silwood1]CAF3499584.1 unnamed protein product [Rotaria sp. Silwood1]CAF4839678.1 unnamed protein product [Rotaria sp. Silwood1]